MAHEVDLALGIETKSASTLSATEIIVVQDMSLHIL